MRMVKRLLRSLTAAVILLLSLASPVFAIANPDSQTINYVSVYQDLLEDNDRLFLIDQNTNYGALPTETATQGLIVRLLTAGGVEVRAVAPYTFQESGWNRNIISIYFSAADAASIPVTWAAAYNIQLAGNPALAWPGVPPTLNGAIDEWYAVDGQSANRAALTSRILYYAEQLELEWSLDLITETSVGNRLSTLGESYFVNVVAGLRTIAPDAFSAGTADPIREDFDPDDATSVALVAGVIGTPLDFTSLGAAFGVSREWASAGLWAIVVAVFVYFVTLPFLGVKVTVLFFDAALVFGALTVMLPLVLIIGLGIGCFVLTGFIFFYKPSSA